MEQVELSAAALQEVADVAAEARDLEGLVRPLLELVTRVTPYEVSYLSVHDRSSGNQLWRFVHVAAGVGPPEGQEWPWNDVLCHWVATRGRRTIVDLAEEIPGHPSNRFLGVRGFVSTPYTLVGRRGEVAGTICGSSREPVDPGEDLLRMFELLATIVADRFAREIELGNERIRAEAAERTLEERTRFLAATEHTLKTPLAVVHGWAETLGERWYELDEETRRRGAAKVHDASRRLLDHVDQLLREAHATLLGGQLRPRPLDLAVVLPALVAEWDEVSSGITVVAGTTEGTARVDERVVEQVLGHLLENATKYAPGSTVTVSSAVVGDLVQLRVEDDGPGLPEDVDLFEPFVRGHRRTAVRGSGLGMYIVRRLVDASGGRVTAANAQTGGARFDITLPGGAAQVRLVNAPVSDT